MLGKFAPLHSTPPGCCNSRAALLQLLGCQVAPKLTGTRNAHGLLHSPAAAAAALCASEHQDSLCRAFCPHQTSTRLTCLHCHTPETCSEVRSTWSSDHTADRCILVHPIGGSAPSFLCGFHICLQPVQDTKWYLETNLCYGLLSSEGLWYPWKWISVVLKKAGQCIPSHPTWQEHGMPNCSIKSILAALNWC